MMREGLAQLIGHQPDMMVCGEAGEAGDALEKVRLLKPNLVLADITLPGRNGLELIKDIQALDAGVAVLVISMHDESFYAERVLRAGGRGYVMKQEGGKKIMEAIRQVSAGQIFVSEKMSARILEIFSGHRPEGGQVAGGKPDRPRIRGFPIDRAGDGHKGIGAGTARQPQNHRSPSRQHQSQTPAQEHGGTDPLRRPLGGVGKAGLIAAENGQKRNIDR